MPETDRDMTSRRPPRGATRSLLLLLVLTRGLWSTTPAEAVCSAIPTPLQQGFTGVRGIVDRPFASPGDFVTVRLRDPAPSSPDDLIVSLIFKPGSVAGTPATSDLGTAHMIVLHGPAGAPLPAACEHVDTTFVERRTQSSVGQPDDRPIELAVGGDPGQPPDRVLFRFPDDYCTDGPAKGARCAGDADCPGSTCRQRLCLGGANHGGTCAAESACPGGDCILAPPIGPIAIVITDVHDPLPCTLVPDDAACLDVVPTTSPPIACVDHLFAETTTSWPPEHHATFPHFTGLPAPNDYGALTTGATPTVQLAVDSDGNALIPIGWSGVLVKGGLATAQNVILPVARLVRFATSVDAFEGRPTQSIDVPDAAFLSAFTPAGARLPPIFEPQVDRRSHGELILFGSADERRSVLRIGRRERACLGGARDQQRCASDSDCEGGSCGVIHTCDGGENAGSHDCRHCCRDAACDATCREGLFDFRSRLLGGIGPAVISRPQFEASADGPIPFDGLIQTETLNAFVVNETLAQQDLDGNDAETGSVAVVQDLDTGREQFLTVPQPCAGVGRRAARLVTRVHQPPFSFYAMDAAEGVVAFLEPEAQPDAAWQDLDCDGDTVDTVLRVFQQGPNDSAHTSLDAFPSAIAAVPDPRVNGRSLAIANGRVFFRATEAGNAPHHITGTELVSVSPTTHLAANASSRRPVISANGRFVAFVSAATDLVTPDGNPASDVFVRDLCRENGRAVAGCTVGTSLVSIGCDTPGAPCQGPNEFAAISADGRFVAFGNGPPDHPDVFVHDRVAGTTVEASLGIPGGSTVVKFGLALVSSGADFVVAFNRRLGPTQRPLYLYDSTHPPAERISELEAYASEPAIAANGRLVAYVASHVVTEDYAAAVEQVLAFDRDCTGGECTTLISATHAGTPDYLPSTGPVVSDDGRFVAFTSHALNLVQGFPIGTRPNVYVRDLRAASAATATTIVRKGVPGFSPYVVKGMSGDARFLAVGGFLAPSEALFVDFVIVDRLTGLPIYASDHGGTEPFPGHGLPREALSGDGRLLVFAAERSPGVTDVFVRDLRAHAVTTDEKDRAADVTADGIVGQTVLRAIDTRSGEAGVIVDVACPATEVAVAGDWAAFLRPEADGPCRGEPGPPRDLNGNQRVADDVVQLWHVPDGPQGVVNLGVAATAITLSPTSIAALVSECATAGLVTDGCPAGGRDLNGDGDAGDTVVHVDTVPPSGWLNLGQAADRVEISGKVAVFTTPEAAQGADLSGDGDRSDRVLQVYDLCPSTQPLSLIPQPVEDFVTGSVSRSGCSADRSELIAFRTYERNRCDAEASSPQPPGTCTRQAPPGCDSLLDCDLNRDGDCCDDVLQVYEMPQRVLRQGPENKAPTLKPCSFDVCDPRVPYRVGQNTVTFLTRECDQRGGHTIGCPDGGTDLNGDFDADDLIVQVLNVRPTGTKLNLLGSVSSGFCSEPNPTTNQVHTCVEDTDCPDGGACRLLANRCLYAHDSCALPPDDSTPANDPCDAGSFCGFYDDEEGAIPECLFIGSTCEENADCQWLVANGYASRGKCEKTGQELQRLASPLKAPGGHGEVFTSIGRCADEDRACNSNADCPNAGACKAELIVATANDADGDEVADPFDNCPTDANPEQGNVCVPTDTCGDGVVTRPEEICDAATDRCIDCTRLCGERPREDCRVAGPTDHASARLVVRQAGGDRAALDFRWSGAPASLPDFGDPLRTTSHAVCLYDGSGMTQPLVEAQALAGRSCATRACWKALGDRGFRYVDKLGGGGLTSVLLGTRRGDRARLRAKGTIAGGLPLSGPVTVQLVNSETAACWRADFSEAERSSATEFKAKLAP